MKSEKLNDVVEWLEKQIKLTSFDERNLNNDGRIKTALIRKIGSELFQSYKKNDNNVFTNMIVAILESNIEYRNTIAFDVLFRAKTRYLGADSHFLMTDIISNNIHDWASCDDFCTHSYGYWLEANPEFLSDVSNYTQSSNPMVRRAAAVSLIYTAKKGMFLDTALNVVDSLLSDENYLVHKATGWLIKEYLVYNPLNQILIDWFLSRENLMSPLTKRYSQFKQRVTLFKSAESTKQTYLKR